MICAAEALDEGATSRSTETNTREIRVMAIQPTQPQGVGGVLDTAFHLYKSSFSAVWPISLLMALVNVLPLGYLIVAGPSLDPASLGSNPFAIYQNPMTLIVALTCFVLGTWVLSALLLKQRAIGADQELSIGGAFQAALPRLLAVVIATILMGLAILVGLIALIVPGVILMVSLFLYMVVLLFDDKGAFDALAGSHKLIWGNWWRTCAVLSVLAILMFVVLFALGFVGALVLPFAGFALKDAYTIAMVIQAVTNFALYVFLGPFGSAALIALYWDLKLRKEGGDLAARVNALSAA